MFKVDGTDIYLTRGDTMTLKVTVTDQDGEEYEIQNGDRIVFRAKEKVDSATVLIEKEVDTSTMILTLDESDTMNLEFKSYLYEMELVTAKDQHYTFIETATIKIGKELEVHG